MIEHTEQELKDAHYFLEQFAHMLKPSQGDKIRGLNRMFRNGILIKGENTADFIKCDMRFDFDAYGNKMDVSICVMKNKEDE